MRFFAFSFHPSVYAVQRATSLFLASGLLFCARKVGLALGPIEAKVRMQLVRNERGFPRIGKVEVEIDPHIPDGAREAAARCLAMFEDYCMVTASVREGVDVEVRVTQ